MVFGPGKRVDWWKEIGVSGVLQTLYFLNVNVGGESTDSCYDQAQVDLAFESHPYP